MTAAKTETPVSPKTGNGVHAKTQDKTTWAGNVPYIKQGTYSDGLPYNELNYLAFKLILVQIFEHFYKTFLQHIFGIGNRLGVPVANTQHGSGKKSV